MHGDRDSTSAMTVPDIVLVKASHTGASHTHSLVIITENPDKACHISCDNPAMDNGNQDDQYTVALSSRTTRLTAVGSSNLRATLETCDDSIGVRSPG